MVGKPTRADEPDSEPNSTLWGGAMNRSDGENPTTDDPFPMGRSERTEDESAIFDSYGVKEPEIERAIICLKDFDEAGFDLAARAVTLKGGLIDARAMTEREIYTVKTEGPRVDEGDIFALILDDGIGWAESGENGAQCPFCEAINWARHSYGVVRFKELDFLDFLQEWRNLDRMADPEDFGGDVVSREICSIQCGIGETEHSVGVWLE